MVRRQNKSYRQQAERRQKRRDMVRAMDSDAFAVAVLLFVVNVSIIGGYFAGMFS